MTDQTTTDTGDLAEWVDLARRKWADYQRLLLGPDDPKNDLAIRIRERGLADLAPLLLAAIDQQRADTEAWLKARRDKCGDGALNAWYVLDDLLDDFREHMATGTPLDRPVEGPHPEPR